MLHDRDADGLLQGLPVARHAGAAHDDDVHDHSIDSVIQSGSAWRMTITSHGGGHVIVDLVGWFTGESAERSAAGLFVPQAPQRLLDQRIVGLGAGAGDQVDQLAPADRPVVRVGRRLFQHRHQAIVEAHRLFRILKVGRASCSIRRTRARKEGAINHPEMAQEFRCRLASCVRVHARARGGAPPIDPLGSSPSPSRPGARTITSPG